MLCSHRRLGALQAQRHPPPLHTGGGGAGGCFVAQERLLCRPCLVTLLLAQRRLLRALLPLL